jgi:DNA-binding response OmpR family regulator
MQLEESTIASNWIMVLDDERDLVSLFKDALESIGYHVYGFTDPLLALEHFTLNTGSTA